VTIHNFVFRMRHNCNSQPPKMHYQWGNPHTSCIRLVPDIWDKVKWGDAVLFRVPYLCQTRVDGWETGCACYVEPPSWGRDAVWLPGATGQKVRERGDAVRGAVPTKRHDLSGFGQVCCVKVLRILAEASLGRLSSRGFSFIDKGDKSVHVEVLRILAEASLCRPFPFEIRIPMLRSRGFSYSTRVGECEYRYR
jgi:hypothetical protein